MRPAPFRRGTAVSGATRRPASRPPAPKPPPPGVVGGGGGAAAADPSEGYRAQPVSYTHLTLPTIC
eukprot:9539698-Prorocentrum_lima.AAC.1